MMQLYGEGTKRGIKRQLEKKKFFLLGQVQTLRTLFTSYVESSYSEDLLQGDVFYSQVFQHFQNLYEQKIDHKFLIDMINIKNQKAESKKLINFLSGALNQMQEVCSNEMLKFEPNLINFPSIYQDFKKQVEEKLIDQKQKKHINIVKKYTYQKLKLLNYFTNMGKLKAFHKLLKVAKKPEELI